MADFSFWIFGTLAVGLGLKHAFDVDHVVAVSNILTRQDRMARTFGLASSWAAGHLLTAALVSAAVYFLADTFLPDLLSRMELLVPVLLIVLGVIGLGQALRRFHVHHHEHQGGGHRHLHAHGRRRHHEHGAMAGIGVVHGLASNDELLIVLVVGLAASSWWQVGLGVLLFSAGVLAGMLLYSLAVRLASGNGQRGWVAQVAMAVFSLASIVYAVYLIAGGQSLNLLAWG